MRNITIFLIIIYQRVISPLFLPSCRFYPSCSEYAIQALRSQGFLKGMYLTFRRILRCHPFCKGGVDPLPDPPDRWNY